jgi:hypothetical protein
VNNQHYVLNQLRSELASVKTTPDPPEQLQQAMAVHEIRIKELNEFLKGKI